MCCMVVILANDSCFCICSGVASVCVGGGGGVWGLLPPLPPSLPLRHSLLPPPLPAGLRLLTRPSCLPLPAHLRPYMVSNPFTCLCPYMVNNVINFLQVNCHLNSVSCFRLILQKRQWYPLFTTTVQLVYVTLCEIFNNTAMFRRQQS